jgi:hypothetical protein
MASLARVILRSRSAHRWIHRVPSGQVRRLYGTANKPVFRWEVSPPTLRWFVRFQNPIPLSPGPIGRRESIVFRGNRYSVRLHSATIIS